MKKITSLQNSKIKDLLKLRKATNRKKSNKILIEGHHEICMALKADINIHSLFVCEEFFGEKNISKQIIDNKIFLVTPEIFKKINFRQNPDGFLAVATLGRLELEDVKLNKNPLVIILEAVEKPGNLGAILRTADGGGADAVIVCESQTDIYNPNVIRASLGTVFSKQVCTCSSEEVIAWLKNKKITSIATTPVANKKYTAINYAKPSAIIIGTEHDGLSEKWLKVADKKIKIPMHGQNDSLNASVSAAIVVYEAVRQRELN